MFKRIEESKLAKVDLLNLRSIPRLARRCFACSMIEAVDTTDGKVFLCPSCRREAIARDFANRRIGPPDKPMCDVCHSNSPQFRSIGLYDFGGEPVNLCPECSIRISEKTR